MCSVNYHDLQMAMDFVSVGGFINARAMVSRKSGQIYLDSDDEGMQDPVPENIDDLELYAEVPAKQDLGLGKPLALEYADRFLNDAFETVDKMFRRPGAYARFKQLLERQGKLEDWYKFEQSAVKKELLGWAESEGLSIDKETLPTNEEGV